MAKNFLYSIRDLAMNSVPWLIFFVVVGLLILGAVVGLVYWSKRRKWNLKVNIKMPRSDGKLILSERAKGHYNPEIGSVDIKRAKLPTTPMKPFDVRKYLQGSNELDVLQVGPNDYIPIHPKSYSVVKDESGKEYAVLDIEANIGKRRTWKIYSERLSKQKYSLDSFFDKYGAQLTLGIVIFLMFLGFSILWVRLGSVCKP